MSDINLLIKKKQEISKKIKEIEECCEGIDNENNARKITELNITKSKLSVEKIDLAKKLSYLESKINEINEEIRIISGDGRQRILEAIKKQRWYFIKNKPNIVLDKQTGILWANLDYFKYSKEGDVRYSLEEVKNILKNLKLDDYTNWRIPTAYEFWDMIEDKSFPYQEGNDWLIKGKYDFFVKCDGKIFVKNLHYSGVKSEIGEAIYNFYKIRNDFIEKASDGFLIPCDSSITTEEYKNNILEENKVYNEIEKLEFTLNLFIDNGLQPIFNDEEITKLFKKIYFEKPRLIKELNEIEEEIKNLQEVILLSSTFDYNLLLSKYDIDAIDSSIIKYYKAVISVIDELMEMLNYYENVKSEIIRDFNIIGLKLSQKYEDNPNLTDEEKKILKDRQKFFKKHFELGMNYVKSNLLNIKIQAQNIEDRIEIINNGQNAIKELSILENEERASFKLIVENSANIIKDALLKIEFFESHSEFATNAIRLWEDWSNNYKIFKTTLKDELRNNCQNDEIEAQNYSIWYDEWQKKRIVIEERFLPLIEYGLKGRLVNQKETKETMIEKVISLLEKYKNNIDKFYIEDRKNIHQKCAFQVAPDLQEKFEAESEIYKFTSEFQMELQNIIFSIEKSEDRLFLLKWADVLLDLQIDEILEFVKDKDLSKISSEILTKFSDLKRKSFEVYISDSKAYSEELKRRENEYNSLIYKMRKDLLK